MPDSSIRLLPLQATTSIALMSDLDVILRVFLVRHGETEQNRKGITQGQMDTVLNEFGHLQANECGRALKDSGVAFARVFSSDLKRAEQVR